MASSSSSSSSTTTMATLQEILQRHKGRRHQIDEILPFLYLGSGESAKKKDDLKNLGITDIMNVADDVPNFHPNDFKYTNLHVADFGQDEGISRVFEEAFKVIKSLDEGKTGKVYVHCAAGANRSATLVIAIVMTIKGMTLKEAFEHVSSRRRICPMTDNRKELLKYELKLLGKNSTDEKDISQMIKKSRGVKKSSSSAKKKSPPPSSSSSSSQKNCNDESKEN
mmetsp:Transcript_3315/g.5127  ORF Transcript_3315/g.5127 Transcript_3315/m.5127 type:complete len:224 (-) Transcript_3315:258-929(-)